MKEIITFKKGDIIKCNYDQDLGVIIADSEKRLATKWCNDGALAGPPMHIIQEGVYVLITDIFRVFDWEPHGSI